MRLARRHAEEPAEDRIDRLFREQYLKMLRLAYTIIGDDGRAEEIVQDGFMDVYRTLDDLHEPAAPAGLRGESVRRARPGSIVPSRRRISRTSPTTSGVLAHLTRTSGSPSS